MRNPCPREPRSRKPLVPAFWTPSAKEAEAADTAVRLAAEDINRCTDKLTAATNRWEEHMRIGGNTMKRYQLLAAKPGERSTRWYKMWEEKLGQMEEDEEAARERRGEAGVGASAPTSRTPLIKQ